MGLQQSKRIFKDDYNTLPHLPDAQTNILSQKNVPTVKAAYMPIRVEAKTKMHFKPGDWDSNLNFHTNRIIIS